MSQIPFQITIGVDIAKKKFDVASLIDSKYKHKIFINDESGYIAFVAWFLPLCGEVNPLICMEATGRIASHSLIFSLIRVMPSAWSIPPRFTRLPKVS